MGTNERPEIRSDADRQFWRCVHSHTRYVYESVADRLLHPTDNAQLVAYEALGIVHAMSHLALEQEQPLAVALCPVALDEGHLTIARAPGAVTPPEET